MGHESCGAVTAAVQAIAGTGESEPRFIQALIAAIEPGLKDLPDQLTGDDRISAAVEANVRWSMTQLTTLPEGEPVIDNGMIHLVGAVYDIATGTVRFLDH
jgi:carbonic anhydrase